MKGFQLLAILAIATLAVVFIVKFDQSSQPPQVTTIQKEPLNSQNTNAQANAVEAIPEETHYLFDIEDNGPEEIKKLLERARTISQQAGDIDKSVNIAMVIHGPDVDLFDKKNYQQHREIVDLAAHLEAEGVIDFKVCQTVANFRGIENTAFPSFMELVPFGPDELDRLEQQGFEKL